MKFAILSDTHFGVRNDSIHFHKFYEKFYSEVFFPYLIKNKIDTVIQLGDLMDRRKYTNHLSLSESKRYFFSKFDEYNIKLITLLGNHDLYFRESLSVSSSDLFLAQFNNVEVINKPTSMFLGYDGHYPKENTNISLIPWVCKENYQDCIDFIKSDSTPLCFGHFEIEGFRMYQGGIACEEGLTTSLFSDYELVMSGHYHHKSKRGNILYAGTPYEMTWQDYGDQKGFHIFDIETRKLNFVKNPLTIFCNIEYDDSTISDITTSTYLDDIYLKQFEASYVKIQVKTKSNPYLFDLFLDKLYSVNPIDVSIIEGVIDIFIEGDIDESDDTITIINKYIDTLNNQDLDNSKLKSLMSALYSEAISIE